MTTPNQPVAVLAAAGFEEQHLTEVQKALLANEIEVKVISPDGGLVQGWHDGAWGHHFMADDSLAEVLSADFSALIVPAGDRSVAGLKQNPHTTRLIKAFADAAKPMVIMGDAGLLLAAAEIADGRQVAVTEASRTELVKAGASALEDAIAVDANLVTTTTEFDLDSLLDQLFTLLVDDDAEVQAA